MFVRALFVRALCTPRLIALTTLVALTIVSFAACGGGGGNDNPPPIGTTPPPGGGGTSSQNPCTTSAAQLEDAAADAAQISATASPEAQAAALLKRLDVFGADDRDVVEPLWEHYLRPGTRSASITDATPSASQDIGEIAVLEDDGTLFLRQNAFDLRNLTLRFERNNSGGYDVTRLEPSFRQTIGSRITLTDDDTSRQTLSFAFPFYGGTQNAVFVNSDGNLTFDESDIASTTRGFARLLGGPPRLAPFFADLDPSTTGGRIFVSSSSSAFVVTYCTVRGFEKTQSTTVQAALLPTGTIEFTFGPDIDLTDGIVALSPGRTGNFAPLDLSGSGRLAGGSAALGERFASTTEFDTVAVARKFYATHPDSYDQLVLFADTQVVNDAFAFESTVTNDIRGIGANTFNQSADFGSAGRLQSYLVMDRLGKYPDDPNARVLGENSTLAVLAHETGHRWLATLRFRDTSSQSSDLLLGRQRAHWSFFMDSDASVMEGNDIESLGGGAFRTIGAVSRYSRLDMYAMGLATAGEVAPFFFVDSPINVQPDRNRESNPQTGVTFNGTRRDILIQDIIDALGPRQPTSAESPRVHRQAYVYITTRGTTPGPEVQKLDRIRQQFAPFFNQATEGRMTVVTTLR